MQKAVVSWPAASIVTRCEYICLRVICVDEWRWIISGGGVGEPVNRSLARGSTDEHTDLMLDHDGERVVGQLLALVHHQHARVDQGVKLAVERLRVRQQLYLCICICGGRGR